MTMPLDTSALEALAAAAPERFVHESDGRWRCPPGERAAAAHRLGYRVRSRREVDWTLLANLDFLADFFAGQCPDPAAPAIAALVAAVRQEPGITLRDVLSLANDKGLAADMVYALLVDRHLVVDLKAQRLSAPESVVVFGDAEAQVAWHLQQRRAGLCPSLPLGASELPVGSIMQWDQRQWTLVQRSETFAVLHDEHGAALALDLDKLAALLRSGELELSDGRRPLSADGRRRLFEASPADLATANRRLAIVADTLSGNDATTHTVPTSTRNDWVRRWKHAEQAHGWGYIGLLPGRRGNRTQRHLADAVIAAMQEVADGVYWTSPGGARSGHGGRLGRAASVLAAYGVLARTCTERGLECPSYRTWRRFLKVGATTERTARRHGPRVAYQQADFAWELEFTVARHGERPWQVCHVDHTPLDVHLVHSQTGRPMGRPYATFLTDAFSRRLLAVSLTYDEPSYRSCYLVLLECVRRWSRLPDVIVVDGGSEFRSLSFETVAAACGMTIRQRPVAAARHGSVIERLFGTSNTRFVHSLIGTTAIAPKPRQRTRRHDPARLAVWTLADLDEALRTWAYEVFDAADHPSLGHSPRSAWLQAVDRVGARQAGVRSVSLEDFRLLAMPSTPKGTATVTHQGLQVNSLLYQGLAIRDRSLRGHAVPVRLDPWDAGTIYAYVHGVWEPCTSTYYAIFQGHSWKEIGVLTQELNQQRRRGEHQRRVSARQLAEFLLGIWEREGAYAERVRHQRDRDLEMTSLRAAGVPSGTHRPIAAQSTEVARQMPDEDARSAEGDTRGLHGIGREHPQPPLRLDRSRLSALPAYR